MPIKRKSDNVPLMIRNREVVVLRSCVARHRCSVVVPRPYEIWRMSRGRAVETARALERLSEALLLTVGEDAEAGVTADKLLHNLAIRIREFSQE